MALSKSEEAQAKVLAEIQPKKMVADVSNLSNYKVKDDFFNKEHSYYDKHNNPKTIKANWRKLYVGGVNVVAFLGEAITKTELAGFEGSKGAKEYYLEKIAKEKPNKKTAAKK